MSSSSNNLLICIEGNINAGKGYFTGGLVRYLQKNNVKVMVMPPTKFSKEPNLYDLFCLEPSRHCANFIMAALEKKLAFIFSGMAENNAVLIMERSLKTESEVFVTALYNTQLISETTYTAITNLIKQIDRLININTCYVYLKTDPVDLFEALLLLNTHACLNKRLLQAIHIQYEQFINALSDADNKIIQLDLPYEAIMKPTSTGVKQCIKSLSQMFPALSHIQIGAGGCSGAQ